MKKTRIVTLVCGVLALFVPSILSAAGSVVLSTPVQAPEGNRVSDEERAEIQRFLEDTRDN